MQIHVFNGVFWRDISNISVIFLFAETSGPGPAKMS